MIRGCGTRRKGQNQHVKQIFLCVPDRVRAMGVAVELNSPGLMIIKLSRVADGVSTEIPYESKT